MKTIRQLKLLILLLFVTQLAKAQSFDMPLNFDSTNVTYTLTDFGGNTSSVVADPVVSTNKVAKAIKSNTAEVWAGTTMGGSSGFATAIAFNSSRTIITMRVYSPDSGIAIRLKVEDPNDGAKSVETEARTTAANTWQTLSFNFINNASGTAAINYTYTYKKASVFFNFGTSGSTAGTKTYYFDDVMFPAATGPVLAQVTLPIYFDSTNVNYATTDFGGNATTIITDPSNSLNKVAQTIKSNTAETWAGTTMSTSSGFANAIPFSSGNSSIRVKVYSPNSGIQVRVKAEDPNDPTKSVETEATTTTANAWEILTFNFANQATGTAAINYGYTYKMLSIFFNFGVTGAIAGTKTYLWDDVQFGTGTVVPQLNFPVTFESTTLNYGLTDFGGNASSIVVDPAVSSNKACKVIKSNTAETWAGTTVGGTVGLGTAIPFTATAKIISMRVYSPSIGTPIRMKVEDPNDAGKSVETEATTTVANAWQSLDFNFANQATGTAAINLAFTYKKISVFFNFGTTGATAGEKTYYFDDITFGSSVVVPQLNMPVTFESTTLNYGLTDFGGNASSIVVDPAVSSNKACKVIKSNTAETWAGTTVGGTVGLGTAIPFTATAKIISMRVYSPSIGTPIRMKVEDPNDAGKSVETEATTTVANAWQTLDFNFANQATGTAAINLAFTYKKISVFFNFGTTGATAGEKTYYFDDITFGSSVVVPQLNMPVTFESTTLNYGLTDFGGNASSIVTDPSVSTNKACKIIKSNIAETWAGTTIGGTTGFGNAIPFSSTASKISMRVYSPSIGTAIRMKAEDPNDAGKSVETEATTTVANAWQILEFNFANQATGTAALNLTYTYKKVSVFFNFGTTGATAGEKTYYFDDVTFGTITPPTSSKVNIKFSVDAKNVPLTANDTVTINGTFNGWCGACNPMTKTPGTNIWSTTIALDTATEIEFKYTVGAWASQENLASTLSCTKTTGTFTNRVYRTTKVNDSIPLSCWESCTACTGTGGATKTYLTFQVDMAKNKPAATDTVTLNGNFNGWCGACTPMTKKPGTDIFMATLLLDKDSSYDFKYSIGNWTSQEMLKEGMTCTTTKSGFTNRTITVSKVNDTLPAVCWESCAKCVTIGVAEQALNNVKVYPNPATEILNVELGKLLENDSKILVYNMLGELMISKTSNQNNGNGTINLDTHSLKQGIYLLKIEADNAVKTIKFQIN